MIRFALTDHDNLGGVDEVRRALKKRRQEGLYTPEFIPGVELSVHFENQDIHLLGLFKDGSLEGIAEFLATQRKARNRRNHEMIAKLNQLGYLLSVDDIPASKDPMRSWGRLHIAQALMKNGYFANVRSAFRTLLMDGKPAHIDRQRVQLADGVRIIKQSGGLAIVAHPQLYGWLTERDDNLVTSLLLAKVKGLKKAGVDGIEAGHGDASGNARKQMLAAAMAYQLDVSQGSDDHGSASPHREMYTRETRRIPESRVAVVCALIRDEAGRVLLGRRAKSERLAGFFELPGGKVKERETNEDALRRELQEELNVTADIGKLHSVLWHDDHDRFYSLLVYATTISRNAKIALRVHDDMRFVTAAEALALNLLPADRVLFQKL